MTRSSRRKIEFPHNREALIERAISAPDGCISVGGLAQELGYLSGVNVGTAVAPPRVFGKLIEFARRQMGWSVEQLARETNIPLAEIVRIETERDFIPQASTVLQLANRLGYSTDRLSELAGLTIARSEPLTAAAVRFAARSESSSQLSELEREAFDQFVQVLVPSSDGT